MSESLGQAFVEVLADVSKLPHGLQEVEHQFKSLGSKFSAGALIAGGAELGAGMIAAYAPVRLLEGAIEGYREHAREGLEASTELGLAQLRLRSAVLGTGFAAGKTSAELEEYAETLESTTGVAKQSIIEFQQQLLSFTKIHGETFDRATKAALDWSVQMGMDMPHAARLLGIALSDPEKGATRLRRAGVVLTEQQKQQIKSFMAVNDVAKAQGVVLDALEARFAGAGERLATPMKKLKAAIHEATVELGNTVKQREPLKLQVKLIVLDVESQLSEAFNLFLQASGYDLFNDTKPDRVKQSKTIADDITQGMLQGLQVLQSASGFQGFFGDALGKAQEDFGALKKANDERARLDKMIRDNQEKAAKKRIDDAGKPPKVDKQLTGMFDLAQLTGRVQESLLNKNDKMIELAEESNRIQESILGAIEGGEGGEGVMVAGP